MLTNLNIIVYFYGALANLTRHWPGETTRQHWIRRWSRCGMCRNPSPSRVSSIPLSCSPREGGKWRDPLLGIFSFHYERRWAKLISPRCRKTFEEYSAFFLPMNASKLGSISACEWMEVFVHYHLIRKQLCDRSTIWMPTIEEFRYGYVYFFIPAIFPLVVSWICDQCMRFILMSTNPIFFWFCDLNS